MRASSARLCSRRVSRRSARAFSETATCARPADASREGEILDLGSDCNVVEKSGAWYSYGGDRIGQGKDNAREFLREHPEMAIEIENKVRAHFGVASRGAAPEEAAA